VKPDLIFGHQKQCGESVACTLHYGTAYLVGVYQENAVVKGVTKPNMNGVWLFYNAITNPKMSQPRPYNMNTYILISAGHDGIYGTKDDICNFEN